MRHRLCLLFLLSSNLLVGQGKFYTHPSWSSNGKIAFDSNLDGTAGVYVMDERGQNVERITPLGVLSGHGQWSPDGNRLIYESHREGNFDIYLYDYSSKTEERITFHDSVDVLGQWAPDGKSIIFLTERNSTPQIYIKEFGKPEELLTDKVAPIISPKFSPDGNYLVFSTIIDGDMEVCISDLKFNEPLTRLTHSPGYDGLGSWSSDGAKVVFTSKRTGSNELFVLNRDGTGLYQLTKNTENSALASWSSDGTKLVFMSRQQGRLSDIYIINADGSGQRKLTAADMKQ